MVNSLKNFMDLFILHTSMSSNDNTQQSNIQGTPVKANVLKGKAAKPTAGNALLARVRSESIATNVAGVSASEKAPASAGGGAASAAPAAPKSGSAQAAQKGVAALAAPTFADLKATVSALTSKKSADKPAPPTSFAEAVTAHQNQETLALVAQLRLEADTTTAKRKEDAIKEAASIRNRLFEQAMELWTAKSKEIQQMVFEIKRILEENATLYTEEMLQICKACLPMRPSRSYRTTMRSWRLGDRLWKPRRLTWLRSPRPLRKRLLKRRMS
jgi:hypothetical protein